MSGGEIGAKKGILSLMIGGDKLKFNKLKNVLNLYSKSLVYMGESGSGQLTKMVNQICVASVIQGLAEALNFAKKKRLNVDNLVEVIKNGAAQSWQLENRAKTMWNNKFNFGFMNKLMLKDLNLIFEENKTSKYKLPITNIIKKNYAELVKMGFSEEDTSNLIRLLK
jgi:3-hydroxyisobutyrate dehydrogenase-like beta-hydroxyacid dehydrogenase